MSYDTARGAMDASRSHGLKSLPFHRKAATPSIRRASYQQMNARREGIARICAGK